MILIFDISYYYVMNKIFVMNKSPIHFCMIADITIFLCNTVNYIIHICIYVISIKMRKRNSEISMKKAFAFSFEQRSSS